MRHVSIWLMLLALTAPAVANDKPNVILIMADDVGVEAFGCYGGTSYETPRIDKMAKQGMRFTCCHSMPLCTPTRVQLLTGLSNARNYVGFSLLRPGETTFASLLKTADYATAVVGKWQLYGAEHYPEAQRGKGSLPEDVGFGTHCLWQVEKLGSRYHGPMMRIDGETKVYAKKAYGPDLSVAHLLDFISANKDGPFLAYFPMALVHSPFVPTPDSAGGAPPRGKQNFAAMMSYMDKIVGKILDRVRELGIEKKTLVLFTSDNGTHRQIRSVRDGKTVRGGKRTTTDRGTHVPLIAWWPDSVQPGTTYGEPIGFSDFLPTFVELARLRTEYRSDGTSFVAALRGRAKKPRPPLTFHFHPRPLRNPKSKPVRFARGKRFKLYTDGRMFDCVNDPDEKRALDRRDDEHAESYERLRVALDAMPPARR